MAGAIYNRCSVILKRGSSYTLSTQFVLLVSEQVVGGVYVNAESIWGRSWIVAGLGGRWRCGVRFDNSCRLESWALWTQTTQLQWSCRLRKTMNSYTIYTCIKNSAENMYCNNLNTCSLKGYRIDTGGSPPLMYRAYEKPSWEAPLMT